MQRRRRRFLLLLLLAACCYLAFAAWSRYSAIATVQNSLGRDWEISFGPVAESGKPPWLPASVDEAVDAYLVDFFENLLKGDSTNRAIVFHERFRGLFRGSIHEIHIYYPEGFCGDLGSALLRFPRLRKLTISANDSNRGSEEQWREILSKVATLPHLEELDISGEKILDSNVAPLAFASKLHTLKISEADLGHGSLETFKTMPALRDLTLNTAFGLPELYGDEAEKIIRAKIPSASISFSR